MGEVGDRTQGFRRMAVRNKPAGIRSLVYGIGKGKVGIEGLSVSSRLEGGVGTRSTLTALHQVGFERGLNVNL
jgi:hypothetical protein